MKKKYLVFSLVLLSYLLLACSTADPVYYDGRGDIDDPSNYGSDQPVAEIYSTVNMMEDIYTGSGFVERGPFYPMKVEVKIEGMNDSEYKEIGTLYGAGSLFGNADKIEVALAYGYTYVYRFTIVNDKSNVNGEIAYVTDDYDSYSSDVSLDRTDFKDIF